MRKKLILLAFIAFYSCLFIGLLNGAGYNWDWTFPVFSQHGSNMVESNLSSWRANGFGTPLNYASGVIVPVLTGIATSTGVQPEYVLFVFIVLLSAIASWTGYRFFEKKGKVLAVLLSLAIWLNPPIFYKLLAGHLIYLVSYVGFILLVTYTLNRRNLSKFDSVAIALLFAISTVQAQFFVYSTIYLAVYFIVFRRFIKWTNIGVIFLIGTTLHLYWLIPFLISSDTGALSTTAKRDSFGGILFTSWKDILTLSFSPGTFIKNFFSKTDRAYFAILFLIPLLAVWFKGKYDRQRTLIGTVMGLILIFLVTGYFHTYDVPFFSNFYPLLRESGHSAPLLVFFLLLISAELIPKVRLGSIGLSLYLLIFIAINVQIFQGSIPRVDNLAARKSFSNFNTFANGVNTTERVLTYPFFNQYSFLDTTTRYIGGTPMNNSGWDSFTIFSGLDFVDNAVSPSGFKQSLQYKFLETHDVSLLKPYNIRYIYDYSDIYQSSADRFLPSDVYDNDLSLIKNDPNFLKKIVGNNPGKVRQISPKILEITDFEPRISGVGVSFKKVNETRYEIKIENNDPVTLLKFLSNFHPGWKLYASDVSKFNCGSYSGNECVPNRKWLFTGEEFGFFIKRPIAVETHQSLAPIGNSWAVANEENVKYLTLYYQPQSWFSLGLVISLLTLFGAITYLIIFRKKLPQPTTEVVVGSESNSSK